MLISLAYTNDTNYTEDIISALGNSAASFFAIDVASVSPVVPVRAKAYRWELADGSLRVLKTATRKRHSFITKPNLLLSNVTNGNVTGTCLDRLTDWFFSESLWINTGFLKDASTSGGLIRVVPTNDELTPEMFQAMIIAQQATVEVETVYPN